MLSLITKRKLFFYVFCYIYITPKKKVSTEDTHSQKTHKSQGFVSPKCVLYARWFRIKMFDFTSPV